MYHEVVHRTFGLNILTNLSLQIEFPVRDLFGVPVGGPRPVIHFQYVKGSEIERRRMTLLRTRAKVAAGETERPWVAVSLWASAS